MADRKRAKKVMHDFNLIHADTKANKNQMEKMIFIYTAPFHSIRTSCQPSSSATIAFY